MKTHVHLLRTQIKSQVSWDMSVTSTLPVAQVDPGFHWSDGLAGWLDFVFREWSCLKKQTNKTERDREDS